MEFCYGGVFFSIEYGLDIILENFFEVRKDIALLLYPHYNLSERCENLYKYNLDDQGFAKYWDENLSACLGFDMNEFK
ncbi:hypothetical protein D7Z94_00180 [Ulvibacterium marinum]|uniref:Uncharacterized protein n=1 Tax=Ulvibacterium marinum TaxID=2419782 RepID=A0A3B0CGZ3_9FLAO|nr:hypothetical protein D7Z94_00180 [Ulvibacterium marinum]